ncbi:uncharacterized protein CG3556 isoform X1 [Nasonia vitripennis]|uniref:Uncharacterized protein n=1 Tax=Nasonia vitripennis TaxID=7425 RepID=A0A7M7R2I0_NASVI|nr:uncharacterized protein CG3556 isoform X1 [Nasonia vitripennis]XP_032458193.1 uncharacterized protein CG3556 isoform X1 [Nasonia vitripennis]
MWGRANMAALTLLFLLGWICIFARAEGARGNGGKPQQSRAAVNAGKADADAVLERASAWLWSQRDKEAGWGNDTQQVLLALRMANLSRDDDVPPPASLEMQLSTKQMELEIVMLLWRHRDLGSSPVRLARYTLALNAMCMDPRQFHGHDLIGTLQHHEPPTDYEFALTALAACNAQAHVRKRQMRRLLEIAHAVQEQNVGELDTVAMGIMTLRCIVQDHRHRNLQHLVRKPSLRLAQRQRRDGSFGDLRTTGLAMQALEEVENEPLDNWNRSAAVLWLAHRQRPDGSFEGDVRSTAEAVLGLAPRGMSSIRTLDCGQGLTDSPPPRIAGINGEITALPVNRGPTTPPVVLPTASTSSSSSQSSASFSSSSQSPAANDDDNNNNNNNEEVEEEDEDDESSFSATSILRQNQQQNPPVNISYTLWVGSDVDEIYNLTLSAPKNESFYEVMVLAAQRSPNFQFSAYEWPNGHYVHTLAGYKEEPMSYHYWLLYRLPAPPEPSSPPGNQLVAPGGVDNLLISEGEHYLFWYKKL